MLRIFSLETCTEDKTGSLRTQGMARSSSLITLLSYLLALPLVGQGMFPVKVDHRWGLIDASGRLVLTPTYDRIGQFDEYGYASMVEGERVGLLGEGPNVVLPARYEDLKVLDQDLIAVMEEASWRVINARGETILPTGYQRLRVLRPGVLAFQQDGKWGLVRADGRRLSSPRYDEIENEDSGLYLTRLENKLGLLSEDGRELLANTAEEIEFLDERLVFFQRSGKWGAVDLQGGGNLPAEYDAYYPLGRRLVKLRRGQQLFAYSPEYGRLVTQQEFQDYYPFSDRAVLVRRGNLLGLLHHDGRHLLPAEFQEIQSFTDLLYRVKREGKWVLVREGGTPQTQEAYDYIAPPRGALAVVKSADRFGLINAQGTLLLTPQHDRIELRDDGADAYDGQGNGAALTRYQVTADGRLETGMNLQNHFRVRVAGSSSQRGAIRNDYLLDKYEWFYQPDTYRWGLRDLQGGKIQIEPVFNSVDVLPDLGLSVVSMESSVRLEFERTTFGFDRVFGLVLNDQGILITEMRFLDIRVADWRAGRPLARVVLENGNHALLDRQGRIIGSPYAYIGEFSEGVARVSMGGRLNASLKPEYPLDRLSGYLHGLIANTLRIDYTQYDQLFAREALLYVEGGKWGYIDSLGRPVLSARYDYAEPFANGVGIVSCEAKWGLVGRNGTELIACRYDELDFLENSGGKVLRLYVEEPKFGLIDTLGRLRIGTMFTDIGAFSEGLLAVRTEQGWAFADTRGEVVIPGPFEEVRGFSEGLAAVRRGKNWGYIDRSGRDVIDPVYSRVGNFSNGRAWVYDGRAVGYIRPDGSFAIPPQFQRAHDFAFARARVVVDNKYGLIDTSGNWVQKPKFIELSAYAAPGLAVASLGGRTPRQLVVDLSGNAVTSTAYREIGPMEEGLAWVRDQRGYGFIDETGTEVIPTRFSKAGNFSEGLAMVQEDGRCGYVNRSGELVIPCEYSRCQEFSGGRAVVYRGLKRAGIVDRAGNQLVEPSLDRLLKFREGRGLMKDDRARFYYITEQAGLYDGYYEEATAFRNGLALVRIDGKWGVINHRGIEVIAPKYDRIEDFENGYAKVKIAGYTGLCDLNGNLLVQPNYERISFVGGGLFRVEQGDQIGYCDAEGRWVWKLKS